MAGELVAVAAQREARQIDEKLFWRWPLKAPRPKPRPVGGDDRVAGRPTHRLAERAEERCWLVTSLWSEQAVGIIGGEPKCCKSFLALDLAVAVAAGAACLRRFAVPHPGRVLLYAAEDAGREIR
jgi:hypothetical protein